MATAAVVSISMGVMKPVLDKLTTLMGDEYRKLKGLRKKVTFLQRELRHMDALLENMDTADELNPQAKIWRKDIIEMSYNIEDCIDDFMQHVGQADDKMGILHKASKYLRTFNNRRRLANQFEEIKAQVMEASECQKRYKLDRSISVTASVAVDPRFSAIYKDSASLVGIDAQKNKLVNWAMHEEQQLKVMAIVGLGGLGKTTLANEVYREIGRKFDCKAFVSISQKPDLIALLNSLLSQLGLATYSHPCQPHDPINRLREHLQDKRYFIVVDDLWDSKAWDTIQHAFPQNSICGRVMITTRNENLARSCCGNHECIYNMEPLREQESKKLFFDIIFGSEDACPCEIKKALSEILKKCGGLPLAIITMASLLASQRPRLEAQCEYILTSLASKFATNPNYEDMIYILDLSYKNLPRHLKACFLYLGSYPEDHVISRVELVRRWVAEGFVSTSMEQDVWDAAESYFNELVNRSMIQPTSYHSTGKVYSCRVHDMLLELILRRCKEDNFLSLVNDPEAVVEMQDKVVRRLNVFFLRGTKDDKGSITTIGVNLAKIRSLWTLGKSNWIPSLLESKFVRVLSLEFSFDMAMDLTIINRLLQLRYLKVGGNGTRIMLPCQIQGLQLLETLDLSGMYNCWISLEIVDAPRLSHLMVPRMYKWSLPHGIGKVKSLRTLHGFHLPMESLEPIIGLGQLTALLDLKLYLPRAPSSKATWMAALATSLDKLVDLSNLYMGAADYFEPVALCTDALISPSPAFRNLEDLNLGSGCTFSRVPSWIGHLRNLCDLRLGVKQLLQEDVAIIGTQLPSLIYLHLWILGVPTERIMIQGSTGFPALEIFVFNCDRTSFLMLEPGAMPELRELELAFDADKWDKAAPAGLQHLLSLERITAWRTSYSRNQRRRPNKKATDVEDVIRKQEAEEALIRGIFQEAVDALPTHPVFVYEYAQLGRPSEEDYSSSEDNPSSEEEDRN